MSHELQLTKIVRSPDTQKESSIPAYSRYYSVWIDLSVMGIDHTDQFRLIVAEKLVEYEIDASSLLKAVNKEPIKFTIIANEVVWQ